MMKRILGIVLVITMILGTNLVYANSSSAILNTAEDTVINSYNALITGDVEKYASLVEDERFPTEAESISLYKENHDMDPLKDFKILSETEINSNTKKFQVELTHSSGYTIQIPTTVQKVEDNWKIIISSDSLDSNVVTEINPGVEKGDTEDGEYTTQEIILTSFNGTVSHYVYGKYSFSTPTTALILGIHEQKGIYTHGVRYEVVKVTNEADVLYGYRNVPGGNITNTKYALSLGTHFQNYIGLRMKILSNGGTYTFRGSLEY
ncbi:DUF4878 domain-containing protein [Ornithinibacillus californiensis]|uniref:DUF4878 domain-containing protein n=1 Tax=Ornithinibacillus californiensis TaxID=161536 RepID=UPI00064D78AD|nr:DUF4878 domain-containing protein [Ornithinibacillus californiensis]